MGEGLSAHAVLLSGTGDLQVVVARKLQGVVDIVFAGDARHPVNRCLVQVAGIVDEASAMLEGEGRGLRLGEENGRFLQVSAVGKDEVAFFLFIGSRGVIEDLLSANDQERRNDKNYRQQKTTGAFQCYLPTSSVGSEPKK